jgi:putative acetyltransferase
MAIRGLSSNDVPAVHAIYNESKLDELRFEDNDFTLLPLHLDVKRREALWESDIYVYDDGKVLGYGALYQNEIRALFVSSEARGKGIGKALMVNLLSKASMPVFLWVAASNKPAIKLYESFHFKIVETFLADYNGVPVLVSGMIKEF